MLIKSLVIGLSESGTRILLTCFPRLSYWDRARIVSSQPWKVWGLCPIAHFLGWAKPRETQLQEKHRAIPKVAIHSGLFHHIPVLSYPWPESTHWPEHTPLGYALHTRALLTYKLSIGSEIVDGVPPLPVIWRPSTAYNKWLCRISSAYPLFHYQDSLINRQHATHSFNTG